MAFDGPGRDAKRVREGCRAERRVRSQQPEELPAYSDIFSDIYSDTGLTDGLDELPRACRHKLPRRLRATLVYHSCITARSPATGSPPDAKVIHESDTRSPGNGVQRRYSPIRCEPPHLP